MFSLFKMRETPSEPYHIQSYQQSNIYFELMVLCKIPYTFFIDIVEVLENKTWS